MPAEVSTGLAESSQNAVSVKHSAQFPHLKTGMHFSHAIQVNPVCSNPLLLYAAHLAQVHLKRAHS